MKEMQLPGAPSAEKDLGRDRLIVRTSVIGILANLFLAGFKAVIGLLSNSIAIVLDAVNNLSDAASSVITIIGTKLAGKEPDRKHPFGYGRIEYLTAMVIALLVLYAGITSFTESVKKILHPETADYSAVALIIIAVAVVVKIVLGRYVKAMGVKTHSDSLINSGEDATLDSVISAATLAAAGIYLFFGLSLEAWLGAVISVVIIKAGIDMLRETLSRILGERADAALAGEIKETVLGFPGIYGAYDLILHDYGPDTYTGSVHISVADTCRADELDVLIRKITMTVYEKTGVILTAVGVYSVNTKDEDSAELEKAIREKVNAHGGVEEIHGFYLDREHKTVRFDVVVGFDVDDRRKVHAEICSELNECYPDYTFQIALDTDFVN
ncbi:MAG: cation diffusion facilitator family transporter [Bacillota bacterium]|jgi:cation diffusion facilitator family transporter